MTLREHLESIGAGADMLSWAGKRTAQRAWEECPDPYWLLRWATKTDVNSPGAIRLAACDCVRTVFHLVPAWEDRPRLAIEAAERFAVDPTEENLKAMEAARTAAFFAATAATAATAAVTANAAAATAAAPGANEMAAVRTAVLAAMNAAAHHATQAAEWYAAKAGMCSIIRKRLVIPWTEQRRLFGLQREDRAQGREPGVRPRAETPCE